jgi:hypothetical protein
MKLVTVDQMRRTLYGQAHVPQLGMLAAHSVIYRA